MLFKTKVNFGEAMIKSQEIQTKSDSIWYYHERNNEIFEYKITQNKQSAELHFN